jgi:predicted aspartyl protease
MKYTFKRDVEGGTIVIPIILSGMGVLNFMLDTGASHTTLDRDIVLMEGYDIHNPIDQTLVETSNGVIEVDVFELESLSAFGITRRNVQVQVYDFLAHNILSNYQGVLGLDFFEGTRFTIDMVENSIVVESLQ